MSRGTETRKPIEARGTHVRAAKKVKTPQPPMPNAELHSRVLRPHSHVVQFYSEDCHLLDSLAALVRQTLNEGNSAVVIATDAHRAGMLERLEASGVQASRMMEEYRLIVLDAEASLASIVVNGIPNPRLFQETFKPVLRRAGSAAVSHNPCVMAFGEMVALLWMREQYEAAIRLEQLWNSLQREETFFLYCAYPLAGFDRQKHLADFQRVCGEHSQVISDEFVVTDAREKIRVRSAAPIARRRAIPAKENPVHRTGRQLPARLLRAQDEEHRRMARDLHDSTGQKLALLSMNLSLMEAQIPNSNAKLVKNMAESREMLRQVSAELRSLSYVLHPPLLEELGLGAALKWFVEGYKERSGIAVSVKIGDEVGRLGRDLEIAFFRVIQEALTNAQRHSGTTTAKVSLERAGDAVILTVSDAGRGIGLEKLSEIESAAVSGVGLGGMRERILHLGGKWEVLSGEKGTEIRAVVPGAAPLPELNLAEGETS
jgi:signal transduction histidine kinase